MHKKIHKIYKSTGVKGRMSQVKVTTSSRPNNRHIITINLQESRRVAQIKEWSIPKVAKESE
jgi:ribosomal protein S28E/S33